MLRRTRKDARVHGDEYIGHKGKCFNAKKVGPDCKCSKLCFLRFNKRERQELFKQFRSLDSYQSQNEYLAKYMREVEVKRRSRFPVRNSRNKNTIYEVVRSSGGEKIKVCRKAFVSFFGITQKRITVLRNKMDSDSFEDSRGIYKKRKLLERLNAEGKENIERGSRESPSPYSDYSCETVGDGIQPESGLERVCLEESSDNGGFANEETIKTNKKRQKGVYYAGEVPVVELVQANRYKKHKKHVEEMSANDVSENSNLNEGNIKSTNNHHNGEPTSSRVDNIVYCESESPKKKKKHKQRHAQEGENGISEDDPLIDATIKKSKNKHHEGDLNYIQEEKIVNSELKSSRKSKKHHKKRHAVQMGANEISEENHLIVTKIEKSKNRNEGEPSCIEVEKIVNSELKSSRKSKKHHKKRHAVQMGANEISEENNLIVTKIKKSKNRNEGEPSCIEVEKIVNAESESSKKKKQHKKRYEVQMCTSEVSPGDPLKIKKSKNKHQEGKPSINEAVSSESGSPKKKKKHTKRHEVDFPSSRKIMNGT